MFHVLSARARDGRRAVTLANARAAVRDLDCLSARLIAAL